MSEGPKILWEQLKGRNVKTNDWQDLGEIKEVTQEYMRLEKGVVGKDKKIEQSVYLMKKDKPD